MTEHAIIVKRQTDKCRQNNTQKTKVWATRPLL